jgi:2-polyprenyl-3-methyl-5-hydroxy-6-metoxy-1,4-benzoquinol methylase/glycosyltransferase involved in cell wall biosynthesis
VRAKEIANGMAEFLLPWARRVSGVTFPADDDLPEHAPGVNTVLNRRRLARWLSAFEQDRDIKDFLLIDAIINSLDIPVSSTGVFGATASLGLRPYRLWEYCWIYKCLGLAKGGLQVLDIGGPASHLSLLSALAGNRIQSVDINPEFVDAANRASVIFSLPNYGAFVCDGRDLTAFAPESFDAVICCSVLEHLTGEDQSIVLDQVARVLRPGGLVGLTFDYGPGAPGANEHLPPPHDPPRSAREALARYQIGGLQMVGNQDLEDPVPGSLFISDIVQYTIASLFLSRAPATQPKPPVPERGQGALFGRFQIPDLVGRSFNAAVARTQAESRQLVREKDLESAARTESALAENRAAEVSRYVNRIEILELAGAEATRAREAQLELWRSEAEAHSTEVARRDAKIESLESDRAFRLAAANSRLDEARRQADNLRAELDITRERAVDREAEYTAARAGLESEAAQSRDSLSKSAESLAILHAEVAKYRESLKTLSAESSSKLLFRRFLGRVPGPGNHYTLHPLPRFISPAAVLAVGHRLVNIGVNRYVKRHSPPPTEMPRITVVTPVYNGEGCVARAIESVLDQHYPNLEYFIEDGASTDRTLEIVERYRDRLAGITSQTDQGMYDAVGRGLEKATGEIFCYLNSDDVLLPGALLRVGKYFARHPKVDVIYHEDVVDVNGWRYPNVAQKHVGFKALLKGHILFQDGVFFRRRAYEAAGGFNRHLRLAGDWDLWTRMARRSRFQRLAGHVSCFYVRDGQMSSRMDDYKAEMDRRRAAIQDEVKLPERVRHALEDLVVRIRNRFDRPRHRLFFPIDFSQMPPPSGQIPDRTEIRRCPITGAAPDRLLFSSRDTRFGFPLICEFHYVPESDLAVCDPPLSDDDLAGLYRTYYSRGNPRVIPPDPQRGSPYRLYRNPGLLLRFVRNILAPRALSRLVRLSSRDDRVPELIACLKSTGVRVQDSLSFLDVGCFEGLLLDTLKQTTSWNLNGIEVNPLAAKTASAKGHKVFTAGALDGVFVLPSDQRFDVVYLGQVIEHLSDPMRAMLRLSMLLKPGGKLVITTPNLDSRQIDLFGPASTLWHPPFHRQIFSLKSLKLMAKKAYLRIDFAETYSHPYWTAMSLWLNNMGLGASVPHDIEIPHHIANHARSIATWSRLFWDHRGKGDYLCVVFSRESH